MPPFPQTKPPTYLPLEELPSQAGNEDKEGDGFPKRDLEDYGYDDPYTAKDPAISAGSEDDAMLRNKQPQMQRSGRRAPRKRAKILKIGTFVPLFALSIQSALLFFLYTFFAVTSRGPVTLPQGLAILVKLNGQSALLAVSLIATIIGASSTKLLTDTIGYALARFLSGPKHVSLYSVAAAVRLSNESPVLYVRRMDWTIVSVMLVIAMGAQTASWTTLLTPKAIPVKATLRGSELDISSPAFRQLMATNEDIVTPELFANSISLVTQSGSTAVSTQLSLPSILNFNQLSYINSTAGTLPATWIPWLSTSTSAAGTMLPPSLAFSGLTSNVKLDRQSLFPVSFSMTQQGFTSRVECRAASLTPTSRPSVTITQSTQGVGQNLNVSVAMMTVGCSGDGYTTLNYDGSGTGAKEGPTRQSEAVLTNSARDAVYATSCAVGEPDGKAHWDLIIVGSGRYSFMDGTICSVWPSTTFVDVHYQDSSSLFNSSFPSFINNTRSWNQTDSPWLGQFVMDIFLRGVVGQGQTTRGSALGDVVRGFVGGANQAQPDAALVPKVLEAYIRGVMEFSITLLRSAYSSSDNGLFENAGSSIPEDMRVPINGTFRTETIGWYQENSRASATLTLVAPSIVGLGTILIVIVSLWWTSRPSWKAAAGQQPATTEAEDTAFAWFDPANLLHIIHASRVGGRTTDIGFPGYDYDLKEWAGDVEVGLGKVQDGVGFTFVQAVR